MIGAGSTVQDHERRTLPQTLEVDLGARCLYISVATRDATPDSHTWRTTQFKIPPASPPIFTSSVLAIAHMHRVEPDAPLE
jgi:hypothetical protein